MPINTTQEKKAKLKTITKTQRKELLAVLNELEFANLFRGSRTRATSGTIRIDIQGVWTAGPGSNIQAQTGTDSIAAIRMATSLGTAQTEDGQNEVVAAVSAALVSSAGDGHWYNVTGTTT